MLNQGDDAATFDLASFLDSTSGTSASPPTLHAPLPSTTTRPQLQLYQPAANDVVAQLAAQVGSLSAMVMEMRDQMLTSSARPTPSLAPPRSQSIAARQAPMESPVVVSWTIPAENGRGPPPPQLRKLRTSSFPTNVGRGRGDYIPHPTHILAAYRSLPGLHKPNGEFTLPTGTLLGFRSAFDLPFDMTIPTASGLYGVRIGSQGLSLSLFRPLSDNERFARSSSNANFSIDFNSNVQPPQASAKYSNYDEILLAISGLTAFSNKFWYPHMHNLLDQLRRFVTDNQSADPGNTPERVLCTLHFTNRYLGRAVGHLADDSPTWWRDFWTATDAIEYRSIEWLLALQSLPAPRPVQATAHAAPTTNTTRRSVPIRAAGMPEDLRKLVPRRSDGTEPCLRFFGGGMCFGGTRDRCAFSYRTHRWEEPLHRDLQAYINKLYGSNRRGHADPRRN